MDKLMAMVEATTSFEVTNLEQIDQKLMQKFLSKNSVWDFYEMGRQEYLNKSNDEKSVLIIKYYNEMVKGKIYILSLFLFSISFSISSKFDSILSAIVSLIMFLSDGLISSGKTVCSESVCLESLSEEPIRSFSKHPLDSLCVDLSSLYSSEPLYELNKDRFLIPFAYTSLIYSFLIFSIDIFFLLKLRSCFKFINNVCKSFPKSLCYW